MTTDTHVVPMAPAGESRSRVLDAGRAMAVLLVAYVHWGEHVLGSSAAGNPAADWPVLSERLAQWRFRGDGLQGLLSSLAFWSSSLLDQCVGFFIGITVVVLALGALRRAELLDKAAQRRAWWRRRIGALWPTWALGHLLMAIVALAAGWGLVLASPKFWLSLAGVRCAPPLMYYLVPAWWYVSALLQLYLLFPLLLGGALRLGPRRLMLVALPAAITLRAVGLLLAPGAWLDVWSRGGIVLSRLPEVVVALALALALAESGRDVDEAAGALLAKPITWFCAATATITGAVAGFFLLGNAISPLLLTAGIGVPVVFVAHKGHRALRWLAAHSLQFYVLHQIPLLLILRPSQVLQPEDVARALAAWCLAVLLTWLAATLLTVVPQTRRPLVRRRVS